LRYQIAGDLYFQYLLAPQVVSINELKDLGGWKTRSMVDRYAKFATENLAFAASRIERGRDGGNVVELLRFCHGQKNKRVGT
jgi:hypothetical protein